jgi:uncharacterized protein (TIRG00374 family)
VTDVAVIGSDRRLTSLGLTALRVLVSVGLMYVIITRVGVSTVVENIRAVPLLVLAASIALSVLNVGIGAWKWQILLDAKGETHSFGRLWVYYYIGQFFNAFFPSTIGGDSVRMLYLRGDVDEGADAFSSVVVERLTGLLGLWLIGSIAAVVAYQQLPVEVFVAIAVTTVIFCCILLVFFSSTTKRLLSSTVFTITVMDLGEKLEQVHTSVNEYRNHSRHLWYALALSIVFHFILSLNNYVMSLGLGMDIPFVYFMIVTPIVAILLFIPISVQGFGVRETLYVVLYGAVGASPDLAFTLGLLMGIVLGVLNNLFGGIVYLGYRLWDP